VNDRLVKQQSRIGGLLLLVTFALLLAGFLFSTQVESWASQAWAREQPWLPIVMTYAIVVVAMGLYYFGNSRMRRYGPQYRQDMKLHQLLKNLDDRHVLYSFLGKGLPDYVLAGPTGVFVLVPKPQTGEFLCRDNRWTRKMSGVARVFATLYGNPLGNPSYDAQEGVKQVRGALEPRLGESLDEVPINGLIVFTGDNVRLRSERCSYPATVGTETRSAIGRGKKRLSNNRLSELRTALDDVAANAMGQK
jgi:hypothetical protein